MSASASFPDIQPSTVCIEFKRHDPKWGIHDFAHRCVYQTDTKQGSVFAGDSKVVKTKTLKIGWQDGHGEYNWMRKGPTISGTFRYWMRPFSEMRGIWGPAVPQLDFDSERSDNIETETEKETKKPTGTESEQDAKPESDKAKSKGKCAAEITVTDEQVRLVGETISRALEIEKDTECDFSVKQQWALLETHLLVKKGFMSEPQRHKIVTDMELGVEEAFSN